MEMRKLNGQDTFLMLKIMAKTGAKKSIKDFLNKQGSFGKEEKTEEDYQRVGVEVMLDVIETVTSNLENAQEDINKLLSKLCNVTIKEIEALDFMEYNTLIVDFFKKEELKNFFKLIFSSIK